MSPGSARPGKLYARRRGRLTRGQALALEQHADRFLLHPEQEPPDWVEVFGTEAPLVLEIGFGMGDALLNFARVHPQQHVIGVELYRPGLGAVLHQAAREQLSNIRLLEGDARELLETAFHPRQLHQINIFFPDPWPKRKHLKRRLIDADFARLLASRLESGGVVNLATDWEPYAEWMFNVLEGEPALRNRQPDGGFAARCADRPITKFEARGQRLGHGVWDLSYVAV